MHSAISALILSWARPARCSSLEPTTAGSYGTYSGSAGAAGCSAAGGDLAAAPVLLCRGKAALSARSAPKQSQVTARYVHTLASRAASRLSQNQKTSCRVVTSARGLQSPYWVLLECCCRTPCSSAGPLITTDGHACWLRPRVARSLGRGHDCARAQQLQSSDATSKRPANG